MELKLGYKQTEVGDIPEDWICPNLGQLVHSVEYGSSAKSRPTGAVPVLRMGNLQDGRVDWQDLVFTSDDREIKRYSLKSGDVLFNRTNTIDLVGKAAIYNGEHPAIFAGYLIRINENKALLDSRLLNYILNAEFSKKYSLKVLSVAVGQANINGRKLKTYLIPLPPTLAEQQSIAEALIDADALIESLEQLLTKKRQIKQGAMQELLTGQRRLPGFSGEWKIKRLDELGRWTGGMTPSMANQTYWQSGTVPWVSSADVKVNRLTTTAFSVTKLAIKEKATTLLPEKSIILVVRSGILRKYLPVAMNIVPMAINQDIKALLPSDTINPEFLLHSLSKHGTQILSRCLKSGTTVESIEFRWLKSFKIPVPCPAEQIAIASILSAMDNEITSLETQLQKARLIKQGMMQELLTGRIRLV